MRCAVAKTLTLKAFSIILNVVGSLVGCLVGSFVFTLSMADMSVGRTIGQSDSDNERHCIAD